MEVLGYFFGAIFGFIALFGFMMLCLWGYAEFLKKFRPDIVAQNRRKVAKQTENREIQKRKKEYNDMKNTAIELGEKHGVALKSAYEKRDSYLSKAWNNMMGDVLGKPLQTSKVTAVYKGTIAEEVAYIGNNIREEKSKQRQETQSKTTANRVEYTRKFVSQEKEVIRLLEKLPNSEKYVEIENRYFDEQMTWLKK